ncbi:hypothetical protein [Pantoea cypripedii]|uniref:Uncharacterized protein n=1 Tax=Pantoea cypripedii TaxID=55209 RepID=A0A6B9G601_PANCY|nr:hypothetical protein [Pantoea cypripedii]QGY31063.1 hypothetical protein CUN67_19870 [Pantoea cypripedii]
MKKGMLIAMLLAFSGTGHAADKVFTGPDCSKDTDARIVGGITDSLNGISGLSLTQNKYFQELIGKGVTRKITRLSSEKISKQEAERLMYRRAKRDGFSPAEIEKSGIKVQYLKMDLYRQYYLIESSKGFKAIAEYYSAVAKGNWSEDDKDAHACGVDLENIYIISDKIEGHTEDFATR